MPSVRSKYQGEGGAYYIVNPKGAIHSVNRDHVVWRLQNFVGYRLAEDDEIEQYREKRSQVWNKPIGAPWNPEPEILPDLPAAKTSNGNAPLATEAAVKLAQEKDIDLNALHGSGASGRILLSDVEAKIQKAK